MAAGPLVFKVESGPRERRWTPVSVRVSKEHTIPAQAELVDEQGLTLPVQVEQNDDGYELSWLVPKLHKGEVKLLTLQEAKGEHFGVRLTDEPGKSVDISVGGKYFTSYHYGADLPRPFLYPLIGPDGVSVTRHFPMKDDVPGEKHDHKHHRSVWFTHGDVNGVDNWSEAEGHGKTVHDEFKKLSEGPVFGDVRAKNRWVDTDGKNLLDSELHIRIYGTPKRLRLMDVMLSLSAGYGDVTLGDTKEGGLVSVRVASSMDATGTGMIETATGAVGEGEAWGRQAPWCHYTGPVQTEAGVRYAGIGIMDHPENPRFPTHWHVRNYGLMTANPLGLSDFYKGQGKNGSLVIKNGESVAFRYRLIVHEGTASDGHMDRHYADFAYPPVMVTVEA